MKTFSLAGFALILACAQPLSAQDVADCKDHPLVGRYPNYNLASCTQNFDRLVFLNAKGEEDPYEGDLTTISYWWGGETDVNAPSSLQVLRNYENAVARIGGKKVFVDQGVACFTLTKGSKEYKIMVSSLNMNGRVVDGYVLSVLEMEPMKQEVSAGEIFEALNKDGYIALNILFETNKAAIQPESQGIVEQIYKMLAENPAVKVSIEGHTDNVGEAATNKKLSEARAKAVLEAIIAKGIDKSRLSSRGWGQDRPVADNRTEDGRAKNRRVEIVKI